MNFSLRAEFIEPGFLNLYFSNDYWLDFLKKINLEGDNFGFRNIGKNKKINIEFVNQLILQDLCILDI